MSWQLGSELCILSPSLRIRYSNVTPNWNRWALKSTNLMSMQSEFVVCEEIIVNYLILQHTGKVTVAPLQFLKQISEGGAWHGLDHTCNRLHQPAQHLQRNTHTHALLLYYKNTTYNTQHLQHTCYSYNIHTTTLFTSFCGYVWFCLLKAIWCNVKQSVQRS